ncbi:hypothetical protein BWL71_06010 [Salmonella enterica]|nr:hypothetical protein [Salmonella enterica]
MHRFDGIGGVNHLADSSLFTGFMKGFADGGDNLMKNTKVITESAGMPGEVLGDLAKQVTGFVGEIAGVVSGFNAKVSADAFTQSLTLAVNSGQSSTGG